MAFMIVIGHYLFIYSTLTVSLTSHNVQISKQSIPNRVYNLEEKHE